MKLNHPMLTRFGGLAIATAVHQWMGTLDYRAAFYDPSVDPAGVSFRGPAIYLLWHEYIPFVFYLRGNCHIALLLSRHRDAEWLAQAARFMGSETVRIDKRGGQARALRELSRVSGRTNIGITPDGPLGPRREMAQGAIFLSSRLGIPLVPIGMGYDRPWRLNTWDRFAVPRPFSRARLVAGPRVQIPAPLDRDGLSYYRREVGRLLNRLTDEAEAWAEAGTRKIGQLPLFRQPMPLASRQAAFRARAA
jgi:lysophospholipid acyltransferase (LPLAT)-like uncharacterized protein